MMEKDSVHYTIDQILDIYQDIFDLEDGEKINSRTPLEAIKTHKFAYLSTNQMKL